MNAEAVRAWLEARYDEDEMRAAGASKGPWHWEGGYPQRISNPQAIVIAETFTNPDFPAYDAEFIAWNNPARVLGDIAAKRRRLERHAAWPWKPLWPGHTCDHYQILGIPADWTGPLTHWCDWCSEMQAREEWFYVPWPCLDIIDDAQAYTDRADFPDELRLP